MLFTKITVALLAVGASAIPLPDGSSSSCMTSMASFTFSAAGGATAQGSDGQVTQINDGQPQAGNGATQAGDGQVQQSSSASQSGDGQVTQNNANEGSDGQPTQGATQISDGQVQQGATQISDGQVQQSATQGGDGQVTQSGSSSNSSGGSCSGANALTLSLNNGVVMDSKGRTAYIASNYQFQFDNPPQSGATGTSGYSICNGMLALDGSTVWWKCKSGDFYNLYSKNWAPQCEQTTFQVTAC